MAQPRFARRQGAAPTGPWAKVGGDDQKCMISFKDFAKGEWRWAPEVVDPSALDGKRVECDRYDVVGLASWLARNPANPTSPHSRLRVTDQDVKDCITEANTLLKKADEGYQLALPGEARDALGRAPAAPALPAAAPAAAAPAAIDPVEVMRGSLARAERTWEAAIERYQTFASTRSDHELETNDNQYRRQRMLNAIETCRDQYESTKLRLRQAEYRQQMVFERSAALARGVREGDAEWNEMVAGWSDWHGPQRMVNEITVDLRRYNTESHARETEAMASIKEWANARGISAAVREEQYDFPGGRYRREQLL